MASRTKFVVARSDRGTIVGYGKGLTYAAAERQCREFIAQEKREGRVASYGNWTLPKPKFRIGQKVRQVALHGRPWISGRVMRVTRLPDSPMTVGCFVGDRTTMGFVTWESDGDWEVAEPARRPAREAA